MGNPRNYSTDLPRRCLALLDNLWTHAEQSYPPSESEELGPLTSTFLISMSMPIINLPIERTERPGNNSGANYVNDGKINSRVSKYIRDTMKKELDITPFYKDKAWRFVYYPTPPVPNLSHGLPSELAKSLATDDAAQRAAKMPASQWCSILRNALAHGGIAYLDKNGRSSYGQPIKMFAFYSGKYDQGSRELIGVNFLRIAEGDYRDFLRQWVDWLQKVGFVEAGRAA